jgi:hypothetical protein
MVGARQLNFRAVEQLLQCELVFADGFMRELTNPVWIKTKGLLLLLLGLLSLTLLFLERPTYRVAALLLLAVWSFCRFYYFAFYVLERYVDPTYRFSSLFSLFRHLLRYPRSRS